jgi:uncharacterized protein (TIGR03067 family)
MKRTLFVLIAAVLLIAADDKKDEAIKKDLEKLQGDWSMASSERNGQKLPDEAAKEYTRTIKDGHVTVFASGKAVVEATIKIDPTKKPKTMDVTYTSGDYKDKTMLGIYEFDGDTCKVCFAPIDKERPTEFAAKEGTDHVVTVWKREKK